MKLLERGTRVQFKSVDSNGFPFEAIGVITGYGEDIRRLSPEEHGGAPDDCYLVSIVSADSMGGQHIIDPDQILGIVKEVK